VNRVSDPRYRPHAVGASRVVGICMAIRRGFSLTSHRVFALRCIGLLGTFVFAIMSVGCGGDEASVKPRGDALAFKELFNGSTFSVADGITVDEVVPGVLKGGLLIRSQPVLEKYWSHPALKGLPMPVVDFSKQSVLAYAVQSSPQNAISITRISESQVIVTTCQPASSSALFPGIVALFLDLKQVDIVANNKPAFEDLVLPRC
jgi:hypothetical protein